MNKKKQPIEVYHPDKKMTILHEKKVVLVGGCFDILHFGHIQFLQQAKAAGSYLIVALEPDERITHNKLRIPIHNQQQRALNLIELRSVDKVVLLPILNGFADYAQLVQAINPHVIAITANDPLLNNKKEQAALINAECTIVIDYIDPFSSTAIHAYYTKKE